MRKTLQEIYRAITIAKFNYTPVVGTSYERYVFDILLLNNEIWG